MVAIYKNSTELLKTGEETFGNRIEFLIEKRGISKNWLAEQLGITKQALNYLLKHASKPKYVDLLAEIMQVNPIWIEIGEGLPFYDSSYQNKQNPSAMLRVYDSASVPSYFNDVLENDIGSEFIDYANKDSDECFAYRIENDSVFPPFMENTVLIFSKDKKPSNSDYVLIMVKSDNSVLVRQYSKDGSDIYYYSQNKDYKRLVGIDATIMGVLIEARYLL